ncbi:MAG: XdhC family protein [Conexibacter sp.]
MRDELTAGAVLRASLAAGRRTVAATLVDVDGSAPLPLGATMLVDEAGQIEGSITGGCVEAAVAQEAQTILERGGPPVLRTYGISDELAGTVGLMCGGTVHVLVRELTRELAAPLLAFHDALDAGRPAGIATLLDAPCPGAALALVEERTIGSLGGPRMLDEHVASDLRGLLASGRSALLRYAPDDSRQGAELRVHLHVKAPPPTLLLVGAIDFSAALAPIAKQLGYRVTICDPRAAFARSPRFAQAAEVVVAWPADALADRQLGEADAVVVFSHDPKLDVPALLAALATGAGYIGALGSRRTTEDRNRRLREAGVTEEMIDRIFAPCGLDLGSSTPEETAIAVLAEIVAHRAGRSGRPLRSTSGPIHARPVPAAGADD